MSKFDSMCDKLIEILHEAALARQAFREGESLDMQHGWEWSPGGQACFKRFEEAQRSFSSQMRQLIQEAIREEKDQTAHTD